MLSLISYVFTVAQCKSRRRIYLCVCVCVCYFFSFKIWDSQMPSFSRECWRRDITCARCLTVKLVFLNRWQVQFLMKPPPQKILYKLKPRKSSRVLHLFRFVNMPRHWSLSNNHFFVSTEQESYFSILLSSYLYLCLNSCFTFVLTSCFIVRCSKSHLQWETLKMWYMHTCIPTFGHFTVIFLL